MSAVSAPCSWQPGFLHNVLPAVETHARIQFRRLRAEQKADAIQEAIASACVAYQRLAAQGRLHVARPSTLATYAVKAVRGGRHVGGHQDAARDVMSSVCRGRHGVQVEILSHRRVTGSGRQGWKALAIADRNQPIPDTAAFRIDFDRWLRMLTRRDRKIIKAFIRGDGTSIVADRLGVSLARVSQLRRQYERGWSVFQGELAA